MDSCTIKVEVCGICGGVVFVDVYVYAYMHIYGNFINHLRCIDFSEPVLNLLG